MRAGQRIVNISGCAQRVYGDAAVSIELGNAVNKMIVDGAKRVEVMEMARTGDNRKFMLTPC